MYISSQETYAGKTALGFDGAVVFTSQGTAGGFFNSGPSFLVESVRMFSAFLALKNWFAKFKSC